MGESRTNEAETAQGSGAGHPAHLPWPIGDAWRLVLDGHRLGNFSGGRRLAFSRFLDVDDALEEGAVFNADAGRGYVAGQGTLGADVDAIGSRDIALDLAEHDDLTGIDRGIDLPVFADGETVARKVDGAFDLAVNIEGLRARNFTFDEKAFADGGLFARRGGCRTRRLRDRSGRCLTNGLRGGSRRRRS